MDLSIAKIAKKAQASRTEAEKAAWKKNCIEKGLCLWCGKAGHVAKLCPTASYNRGKDLTALAAKMVAEGESTTSEPGNA